MFPRRGRAHDRVISAHLRTSLALLSPTPRLPTFPRSLAPSAQPSRPSLAMRTRSDSSAAAHRRPPSVLRPSSSPRPICYLGEFRLAVSYSGYPLVCPFPLLFALFALTVAFLAQPEPATVDPRLHRTPAVLQASRSSHSR
jgi:hypothetical protein